MSEWMDISTAPKDGTEILGASRGEITTVFYWREYGNWEIAVTGAWADNGEWHPTHWMPLPDPPKD